jgi:hypothetical protein
VYDDSTGRNGTRAGGLHLSRSVPTIDHMGKKKEPELPKSSKPRTGDRHAKKPFHLRLDERLRAVLEKLADRNATDVTAEIIASIRERLERLGLWPPA